MTTTRAIHADTVGSMLRPPELRDAALRKLIGAEGGPSPEELDQVADQGVLDAIAVQESAGVDVITDGEIRRFLYIDPSAWLSGITPIPAEETAEVHWENADGPLEGFNHAMPAEAVTMPIEIARPGFFRDEFAFLAAHAHTRTKITLGSPSMMRLHWHRDHSRDAYPNIEDFLFAARDLTQQIVRELASIGCTYIQLDAPLYSVLGDPAVVSALASRGNKFGEDPAFDAELDSSVFDDVEGVTTGIHLCRGNGPGGAWLASCGYEAIAKDLFPKLAFDRLLLEYDTSRSGGFEPLREVPEDVVAVLGLVTTKTGELEDADAVEARVRDAATHKSLETLALSPQCGFAPGAMSSPMTFEEQEAKLRLTADVARRVWS